MSGLCGVCEEPLTDAGTLCHGDARRLAFTLRDVPALAAELDTTITRQAAIAHRPGPRVSLEMDPVRLPYHEGASNALDGLCTSLKGWAENLADDTGHSLPTVYAPTFYAGWLAARMAEVRMRDWAPDMHAEVTDAVCRARRAIDAPPDLEFWGRCPGPECDAELWAARHADTIVCRDCEAAHDPDTLRAAAYTDAAHVRGTAPVIAAALGIKTARVYKWTQRGFLAPVGLDPRTGASLYRLGDVRAVKDRMDRRVPKGVLGRPKGGK